MKKGFTLVELLSVILILSMVMLIAIPTINSAANNVKKSNLETIKSMLESTMLKYAGQYYIDRIKEAGDTCSSNDCCGYFSIDFIKDYNIFQSNNDSIIDPVTGKDLEGYIKVSYDINKLDLVAEYVQNADDNCKVKMELEEED